MEEDMILSYEWLAERNFDVCSRNHGLRTWVHNTIIWLPGKRENPSPRENARLHSEPVQGHAATISNAGPIGVPKRALNLFCGRKSVASVLQKWGYEVHTLDLDPSRDPTICEDILTWDYQKAYPPGYFDLVAASPLARPIRP
jgi:hypothetical protein